MSKTQITTTVDDITPWFEHKAFRSDIWHHHIVPLFTPKEYIRLALLSRQFHTDIQEKIKNEGLCIALFTYSSCYDDDEERDHLYPTYCGCTNDKCNPEGNCILTVSATSVNPNLYERTTYMTIQSLPIKEISCKDASMYGGTPHSMMITTERDVIVSWNEELDYNVTCQTILLHDSDASYVSSNKAIHRSHIHTLCHDRLHVDLEIGNLQLHEMYSIWDWKFYWGRQLTRKQVYHRMLPLIKKEAIACQTYYNI